MRVAILGTGYIAGVHARATRALGGEVVAVLGRTRAAAEAFGRGTPYERLDALLAAGGLDAVHICTPNAAHADQAVAAFEAGLHVLCEKPVATSTAEARRMIAAAEAAGRVGAVCFNYRGYPLVEVMRRRIADGSLGELRRIGGTYYSEDMCDPDKYAWHFSPGMVGPAFALMDLGVHWFDLLEHVTGLRIVEITAQFSTHQGERIWRGRSGEGPRPAGRPLADGGVAVAVEMEEQADLLLRADSGAAGSMTVSAASVGHPNTLSISLDGSAGGLDWNQQDPDVMRERSLGATLVRHRRPADGTRGGGLPPGHPEGYFDAFCNVIADCWAAMDGRSAAYPDLWDGLRSVALVEAAVESARERRPVRPAHAPRSR